MAGLELQSIGKYEIKNVLGRGAMGVVYRGFDPNIAREVAIKTIHKSLLATEMGQELLQRFRNEAQAVGRLAHPNIVSIYEFDTEDGMPFFVMELVEGKELKDFYKQGKSFTIHEVIQICGGILEGLSYTHGLGIIHRDIKPANIFVLNDGSIKIADFGIARVDNSELTQIGSVLGTPSYMSPEQCTGRSIDARSDLFSVGVLLYEMLTGIKPFKGDNSNTIMLNVVNTEPQKPSSVNEVLPKCFDTLLRKALAKKQDQRFQTAADFKAALNACADAAKPSPQQRSPIILGAAGVGLASVGLAAWFLLSPTSQMPDDANTARTISNMPSSTDRRTVVDNFQSASVSVDDKDVKKAERLLKVARAHMLVGRLISPQGSNAHDAYQLVLSLDPGSEGAKQGLQEVAGKLVARTEALGGEGNQSEARRHLQQSLKLFPSHPALLALQAKLGVTTQ